MLLSAVEADTLPVMAEQLRAHLTHTRSLALDDVAHTLQVGREALPVRVAFCATSLDALCAQLRAFAAAPDAAHPGIVRGIARDAGAPEWDVERCRRASAAELAAAWAGGAVIPWARLGATGGVKRVRLPGYPFERRRHWAAASPSGTPAARDAAGDGPGPIDAAYECRLDASAFYLRDHRVNGRPILPGVMYLELFGRALRAAGQPIPPLVLRDVVWLQPAWADASGMTVRVRIQPAAGGRLLELVSDGPAGADVVHGRGEAAEPRDEPARGRIDLDALRARAKLELNGADCYPRLAKAGFEYGPGHQCIERLWAGNDGVLAELRDPRMPAGESFVVHPGLFDSALQAAFGLDILDVEDPGAAVPFSLEHFELAAPVPDGPLWAWVRYRAGTATGVVRRIDVDLLDARGQAVALLHGLAVRTLPRKAADDAGASMPDDGAASGTPSRPAAGAEQFGRAPTVQTASTASTTSATPAASSAPARPTASPPLPDAGLRERALAFFRDRFARILRLHDGTLDEHAQLEQYGIDSLMIIRLTDDLEQTFGRLSKTLFFEHQTLGELVDYFVSAHAQRLGDAIAAERQSMAGPSNEADEADARVPPVQPEPRDASAMLDASASAPLDAQRAGQPALPAASAAAPALSDAAGASDDDIAIIGLAGRYPGARDMDEFWARLSGGCDMIREIPPERWDHARFYDPERNKIGKTYCRHGGFIDDVDKFDPLFFGISPREAVGMEPQERLFVECAYEAMQDAGYTRASLPGAPGGGKGRHVGVFVGVMYEEYPLFGAESAARGQPFAVPGHPASIANRVSYLFNLQGPSLALDTMCSSSLTALHLACRSIRDGECAMAIAGGVNVSIHPNKYLMLGQGGFASAKGRCESFGEGGEGYVPGEGVGAVLLKRKRDAIADGDQIYGIVRASALNHGGKTNGYTVPNPAAQAAVIALALAKAGIAPRAVSYIEAHGTGTALGDPIEIAGLARAFGGDAQDRQFCAIGSVKSNIGHCESAAGIAGISKVLLQMRHRQLAPSLHAETLNPNIDFEHSPFRVQRELAPWPRPVVPVHGVDTELPRIAGISSFGAGGANAHVLIEEYVEPRAEPAEPARTQQPVAIVVSAKTQAALRQSAERLLLAVRRNGWRDAELPRIAYTLQTGREAMSERLGLITSSLDDLGARLAAYVAGDAAAANVRTGKARAARADQPPISPRDGLDAALSAWVDGAQIDWLAGYDEPRPRKIGLPAYPFARERYWVTDLLEPSGGAAPDAYAPDAVRPGRLHPLLHTNTSRVGLQRFSSRFDGREFVLDDHRIDGERLLPAAAFIEMFAAAAASSGMRPGGTRALQLANLAWLQPAWQRDAALSLDIEVRGEPGAGAWALRCADGDDAQRQYAQASASLVDAHARRHDLAALSAACGREVSGDALYQRYRGAGYGYGAAFRSIVALRAADDHALARLEVDAAQTAALLTPFGMPPTLLDGALQATAAFAGAGDDTRPLLPFSIERVEWRGPCERVMWALARRRDDGARVAKFDIDLCDEDGLVRVAIVGYGALRLDAPASGAPAAKTAAAPAAQRGGDSTASAQAYYFLPRWSEAPAAAAVERTPDARLLIAAASHADLDRFATSCAHAARILLESHLDSGEIEARLARREFDHLVWIAPSSGDASPFDRAAVERAQQAGVLPAFRLVKALQRLKAAPQAFELTVVQTQAHGFPGDRFDFAQSGMHGIVGTIAKEMPRWRVRHVDIERVEDAQAGGGARLEALLAQPCDALGTLRMQRGGRWYAKQWLRAEFDARSERMPLRRNGVYVVIGGAGGIGAAWSAHAIRECDAQVVWVGRKALDAEIGARIDACAHGARAPSYYQADACDPAALDACLSAVRARFGAIHGVIHSAVVLEDSTLANMDEASFRRVYFGKVDSSVNLGIALRDAPPDFLLFFSSTVVFTPPPGQANYSAGCLFQNALAARLASDLGCAVKVVDWGYWGSVGVGATPRYRAIMARNGIASIEPGDGMAALAQLFGQDVDELALLKVTDQVAYPRALLPPDEMLQVLPHDAAFADAPPELDGDLADCAMVLLAQAAARMGAAPTLLDVDGRAALDTGLPQRLLAHPQRCGAYVIGAVDDARDAPAASAAARLPDLPVLRIGAAPNVTRDAHAPFDLVLARVDGETGSDALLRRLKRLMKRGGWLLVRDDGTGYAVRDALRREGFAPRRAANGIWLATHDGVVRIAARAPDAPSPHAVSHGASAVARPPEAAAPAGGQANAPGSGQTRATRSTADVRTADGAYERLVDASLAYFKGLIAAELDIPFDRLDVDEPLDGYGIDSIYSVRLVTKLNESFSDVSNTLFFEVQTIRGLVEHFVASHRRELEALVGVAPVADTAGGGSAARVSQPTPTPTLPSSTSRPMRPPAVTPPSPPSADDASRTASRACDIAVIGMSGRYAQADDLDEFWRNLREGRNCISEIPSDRWDWRAHFDAERGKWGKHYTKWGGFVRDIDAFDPLFFQISPTEAERMDPQARLFVEQAYASIEDAGYTPATLAPGNRVGVFVGAMNADYVNGASYWSIANRVSYLFDLKGPSLAVDTACSSSLSAIHLAIESIVAGSCDCAIAGGVSLIMSPAHYMGLSTMGMLAGDDKCRAFGADAEGFVVGEGVGALVLKPLQAAVDAGDHIYGVIKASALNAGGRTSGFTVPNPAAQADVIGDAIRRSGVPASQFGYVEAHGTGTPLGDPIEIKGLADAFARAGGGASCALGSVKGNIGHCESAAGIAGVTKVLLQMQHATLLPSLHAERPNPRIDFTRTPFRLQRGVEPWPRPMLSAGGAADELARTAGVSSFGAGGANAHLVIQEYRGEYRDEPADVADDHPGTVAIVLSARTREQLTGRAERLLERLRDAARPIPLRDLAYTLQIGREAMEHRLALTAASHEAVCGALDAFLSGRHASRVDIHVGCVDDHRASIGLLQGDDDLREAIERWFEKEKWTKLLALWVKGLHVDWARLYRGARARRVSLPTYPFAKERFWLDLGVESLHALTMRAGPPSPHRAAPLHPLLHENRSTLDGLRFTSRIDAGEPVLADHRIHGRALLPAAAQIELIRAAADAAAGAAAQDVLPMRLRDLAWVEPVDADAAIELDVRLQRGDGDRLSFALTSGLKSGASASSAAIHCQGAIETRDVLPESRTVDLDALRRRYQPLPVTPESFYQRLAAAGMVYGPSLRTLTWAGDAPGSLLVRLSAQPAAGAGTADARWTIDPGLLDGALQALVLFDARSAAGASDSGTPAALPFAAERIELYRRCRGALWAQLSRRAPRGALGAAFDIDLYDDAGAVCLSIRGLSTRSPGAGMPAAAAAQPDEIVMLAPCWVPADL
ncbi:hypothetical protein AQ611_19950 [Burkholderia singularis]|nr:hypothetical protein AQ611_19950 [Burkholderia sp. Bp7605]